jgi:hypothetical protein
MVLLKYIILKISMAFSKRVKINRLLVNCCEYLRPMVIIAFNTGCVREIFWGLNGDMDIKRGIIHLFDIKSEEIREIHR